MVYNAEGQENSCVIHIFFNSELFTLKKFQLPINRWLIVNSCFIVTIYKEELSGSPINDGFNGIGKIDILFFLLLNVIIEEKH